MTWSYAYRPDIWPALVTLALVIYLGQYSWRRREIPAAVPFAVACALCAFWVLGVILELSAVDVPSQVFWRKFQAIWQLPVGTAVTCFILRFAGLDRWLSLRNCVLLFAVPFVSILVIVTNDVHHLMWIGFQASGHVIALPGRLYWFFNSYVYLLGLINLVILVWLAVRSPRHRWPVAIILWGQFIARVGFALEKSEVEWLGLGESVLATIGIVAVTYAIAFFGFHVIDPVTTARTAALRQMREGMYVLDLQGRILDVNPMGAAVLGISEARLRGQVASEVLPFDVGSPESSDKQEIGREDIVLENTDPARQYSVNRALLRGRDGEPIGQLVLLHDITDQKRAQTQLLKQQSALAALKERERLARELHDGIAQVLGYMGMQTQAALKWMRDGDGTQAKSILERLAEVAKEAHADVRESILSLRADSVPEWSFIPTLRKYLERFEANYSLPTVLSISERIGEDTFEPGAAVQLLRVVQEALTNSRKHSGARTLSVSVGMNGSKAYISIADDGLGFDAGRLEGDNGSHFGLVFMRERMEQIGGSLKIESTPGGGTVLRLDVPTRDQGREAGESASRG